MIPQKKGKAIVVGSSAGGMSALSAILNEIPRDYHLPIIIAQHRIKDQNDLFEEVLQTKCKIFIKQADEKEEIRAGYVYTAPPNYHLLIENDYTFALSDEDPVSHSRPSIDVLFESAASVYRNELIGVILTGANKDGALGISAIKKYGGLTIAQDPEEASFSFMPLASIQTGCVDYVYKLDQIRSFMLNQVHEKHERNR